VEQIKKVTPEDIKRVANTYLIQDSLTVAELKPLPLKSDQDAPMMQNGDNSHVQ